MPLPHVAPGDPHTAAHNAERDVINTLDGKVIDATTAAKGLVELATSAETTTGTDAVRAVTPAGLKAVTDALPAPAPAASTTVSGIVELATNAETTTGTDAVRAVTPAGLKAVTDALPSPVQPDATTAAKGIVELATNAEALAGTDAVRAVTPAALKAVTDALPTGGGGGGTGDVTGPAGATDSVVALFNGTTGKVIKDGGVTVAQLRDRSTHTGNTPAANVSGLAPVATSGSASDLSSGTVADARLPSRLAQSSLDIAYEPAARALNIQTVSYTLVASDWNKIIYYNSASAGTLTIPPDSSVNFPNGTYIEIFNANAGDLQLVPGSGVGLLSPAGLWLRDMYAMGGIRKMYANNWAVVGRTTT